MGSILSRPANIIQVSEGVIAKNSTAGFGALIAGGVVTVIGGKSDGEVLSDFVVQSGQTVKIDLGVVNVRNYNAMVTVNTELFSEGIVNCPTILDPGKNNLFLIFSARKKIDLKTLTHFVTIFLID